MATLGTTTIFPAPAPIDQLISHLERLAEEATLEAGNYEIAASVTHRALEPVLNEIIVILRAQTTAMRLLRQSLEHAQVALQQQINQRPGVGIIAERPSPDRNGMLYFSTDETPERLYVAAVRS